MTDYTDLIARLREDDPATWPPCAEAADALEAQARRIAELEYDATYHESNDEVMMRDIEYYRARIAELEAELTSEQDRADRIARELDALRWEQEASAEYTKQMRKALKDTTVCLIAAVSLLESGGKKAAPSNEMFDQMLVDYKNGVERARDALEKENG